MEDAPISASGWDERSSYRLKESTHIGLCRFERRRAMLASSPHTGHEDRPGEFAADLRGWRSAHVHRRARSERTDVLYIESLQTGVDRVKNVLSAQTAVVGMSVLLFQNVLFHSDTLQQGQAISPVHSLHHT